VRDALAKINFANVLLGALGARSSERATTARRTGEKREPRRPARHLALVPALLPNPPQQIVLLDDVLTIRCRFTACRAMPRETLP
jgi:hypothetical protein